jgi:hypothetical protein
VVTGDTDKLSLYISIAISLTLDFLARYSVIPKNLLFKKLFFDTGPFISLLEKFLLIKLRATSKEF